MDKKQVKSKQKNTSKINKRLKKKRKYKITKKITMEDIYRILNRVQINKKNAKFSVEFSEAETVENVICDLRLPHERINMKTKTTFIVKPNPNDNEYEDININFDLDFIDDEIVEEGQLF